MLKLNHNTETYQLLEVAKTVCRHHSPHAPYPDIDRLMDERENSWDIAVADTLVSGMCVTVTWEIDVALQGRQAGVTQSPQLIHRQPASTSAE